MFYVVLYRARHIPRWLSGWGLIAAVPYLATGLWNLFGLISLLSTTQTALVAPMAVQEMVMAGWLIVKGLISQVVVAGAARSALQPAAN